MKEDEVVLEALEGAENRRVFYINVGRLPPKKAEQVLKELVKKYKEAKTND